MAKKIIFVTLFSIFFALGCQKTNVTFNSAKWKQHDWVESPGRNLMADDLVASHKLIGLSHQKMLALLGPPSPIVDTKDTYYELSQKYEGADPVSGRDLIITFNKDSVITNARIKVWHKY